MLSLTRVPQTNTINFKVSENVLKKTVVKKKSLYRVSQELRSILLDLIPELILSQVIYTWVQFTTALEL